MSDHGRPDGTDVINNTLAIVEPDLRPDEVEWPELPEVQMPETD